MYRNYILLFLIIFIFFSCDKKQKHETQKKEISFSPPVTINASQPIITLLDTCPKPSIIIIPTKDSSQCVIQTQNGLKTIKLFPSKKIPILAGEAGGYTFMQNFNTEQGLALSGINCGYKDKTGNLWFGTAGGGVSKYDGKSFTNYTSSQGLANNHVVCIYEDKTGILWFGTSGGGVSKYDGNFFTNFTTDQGLVNNRVVNIMEDKIGNLWFCTAGGISRLAPNKLISDKTGGVSLFTNFTTSQGLVGNNVVSCITDKKGNLWFGTDKGISIYNSNIKEVAGAKCFTNLTTANGLVNNEVECILEDKTGTIWFGTLGGVSRANTDSLLESIKTKGSEKLKTNSLFTNFTRAQGLLGNGVICITEDRSGNLWFGNGGVGICKYTPSLKEGVCAKSFTNFTPAQGLSNNQVTCIIEDQQGSLWIGSMGGLNKYDGKSFTSFTIDQGLAYNKVWSITEDKGKNLWFATSSGISIYDRNYFTNMRLPYVTVNVRCVIVDRIGNVWFGSSTGVTKYDGKSYTNFNTTHGLPHNTVLSIAEDKIGNLWFGTFGGGICKYDGNRVDALEKGEKIFPENQQDLKKINGKFVKSFTNYSSSQGLSGNTVKCMVCDKMGNMWFGTNGNGISKFDGKTFTNYTTAQGLSLNTIYSMLEDKAGTIWIGTAGGGVCRLMPSVKTGEVAVFTTYTTAQGLANDVVYAIVEDTLKNIIWFGTNLGLSGLKLNSLSSGKDGAAFENFNIKTGYPIKDLNTGALFLDEKGILWAGTSDKLVRFDYSGIHKSIDPPTVLIQAVKIQGSTIGWYNLKYEISNGAGKNKSDSLAILNEEITTNSQPLSEGQRDAMRKKFGDIKFDSITRFYYVPEHLVLPFVHNNITFDFLAIETARPSLVSYQYMLEGYDKEWYPLTNTTTATFGNIHEGIYTFKLKARSPDGVWSEPVNYTFKVLPPWYRTWWMYLAYLFIGLSVIRLLFRWRTASLRKEKEILEQTVIARTTEVVEQKELVEKKNEFIEEKQKAIVDSINYAKRIQYALLAHDSVLRQNLKDYFVLFQPKDIVSGDFYWATKTIDNRQSANGEEEKTERFYLAICDSTGHGVPGAFMSLLNISFLNEAITEKNIKQPNEILNHARQCLIESVSQDGAQDGMDGILLCFENGKITYAAANNAPVIVRNNSIINLPYDKMPVGKGEVDISFTLYTIDTEKGDLLYFYTDGYADQFGGSKGKKFKYKQLENLLISVNQKSMEEQKQIFSTTIEKWKGNLDQVDDILIIGMRIGY